MKCAIADRRMLAIGIHGQHMREARLLGRAQAMQNGAPLPPILGPAEHTQSWVAPRPCGKRLAGAIGAAIDDDPDRPPRIAAAATVSNSFAPVL